MKIFEKNPLTLLRHTHQSTFSWSALSPHKHSNGGMVFVVVTKGCELAWNLKPYDVLKDKFGKKKNANFNFFSENGRCWNGKNINALSSEGC